MKINVRVGVGVIGHPLGGTIYFQGGGRLGFFVAEKLFISTRLNFLFNQMFTYYSFHAKYTRNYLL